MSLPLPRLDDRTWQDLRDEGVSLIPRHAPGWTNHNISDPGITLIELLAHYTELALFRLDQIGEPFSRAFLRLLGDGRLPAGPRPATTLLQFDPTPGSAPTGADAVVRAGAYFVPRRSPTDPAAEPRRGRTTGIGAVVEPPALRSAGEPDEPLLRSVASAAPPEAAAIPEFGFRAAHELFLTGIRLAAVQSFDGRVFRDITPALTKSRPAPIWGVAPVDPKDRAAGEQPAVHLGFNLSFFNALLPPNANGIDDWGLTLWCVPAGFGPADLSAPEPDPDDDAPPSFQPHAPNRRPAHRHGATIRWEYLIGDEWRAVPIAEPFRDETQGFTRPGRVVIPGRVFQTAAAALQRANRVIGAVPAAHFYLRARLVEGLPDAAPEVCGFFVDAVLVEQWDQAATPFTPRFDESTTPPRLVLPEVLENLALAEEARADVVDAAKELARRGWGPDAGNWPEWPLWSPDGFEKGGPDWEVDHSPDPPQYRINAVVVGVSEGAPNQEFPLPCPRTNTLFRPESADDPDDGPAVRVMTDGLRVWTLEPPWGWLPTDPAASPSRKRRAVEWVPVPDLFPGSRTIPEFLYEPTPISGGSQSRYAAPGRIIFGDGQSGRVPPPGSLILASYSWTVAEAANVSPGFIWARSTDRDPDHRDRVRSLPTVRFRNPLPTDGGRDAEPLSAALRRLANEFQAPEALIDLAATGGGNTLDGVDITGAIPPSMAVNLLDFECLARSTPGTRVARARAWANADPTFPGIVAPGAVTVVVVPFLPADAPSPSAELLQRVRALLRERRPLACRVFVVGPEHQPVRVQATLHVATTARNETRQAAEAAVRTFLHPLRGGPSGGGWPFGRDLRAGELTRVLAEVPGVAHVTGLRVAAGDGPWSDAAVCLPARALPQLTELSFDVEGDA